MFILQQQHPLLEWIFKIAFLKAYKAFSHAQSNLKVSSSPVSGDSSFSFSTILVLLNRNENLQVLKKKKLRGYRALFQLPLCPGNGHQYQVKLFQSKTNTSFFILTLQLCVTLILGVHWVAQDKLGKLPINIEATLFLVDASCVVSQQKRKNRLLELNSISILR